MANGVEAYSVCVNSFHETASWRSLALLDGLTKEVHKVRDDYRFSAMDGNSVGVVWKRL